MAYIIECNKSLFLEAFKRVKAVCNSNVKWRQINVRTFVIILSDKSDELWVDYPLNNLGMRINYTKIENSLLKDIEKVVALRQMQN